MRRNLSAFLAAGFVLGGVVSTSAQGVSEGLPPYDVLSSVRSAGLDPLGPPARRGGTYVLRALDRRGTEMRVVVDARRGAVVSVTPVVPARLARPIERDDEVYEPYERISPPGVYLPPEPLPPGVYRSAPPDYDEPERPLYGPPAGRAAPSGRSASNPPRTIPAEPPRVIPAPDSGDNDGALPAPPERFPPRAAPGAETKKPAPKRAASATPAKPPVPKPRPAVPPAPNVDASPMPPPIPDNGTDDAVPH